MSEMVERVIKEIDRYYVHPGADGWYVYDMVRWAERAGLIPDSNPPLAFDRRWDRWEDATHFARQENARAVIAAMREPTEAMVKSAFEGTSFAWARKIEIADGWCAMIDEALK